MIKVNLSDKRRVFTELWKKSDVRCMQCGKQLEENDAVIDYTLRGNMAAQIVPKT